MSKPTIGLAIIARNEGKVLKGCIDSCRGIDQISVVDTGSVDRTVEIAKECGAEVAEIRWPDPPAQGEIWGPQHIAGVDFSAARNLSVDLLQTDWFIFLDADERLDKAHIWNVRNDIDKIKESDIGAILVTMYTEKGDHFWREKVLRRVPETRFIGRVHECISNEMMNAKLLDGVKIHYEQRANSGRNYAILREEILTSENVNDMRLQYLMGREEFCFGNHPAAAYWLDRYWRTYTMSGKNHPMRAADASFTCAMAHAAMGDFKQAKNYATICIGINPDFREGAHLLADLARHEGNALAQNRWIEMSKTAQNIGSSFRSKYFQKATGQAVAA